MSTDTPNLVPGVVTQLLVLVECLLEESIKFDTIDYVNIASTGNAADFGNLTKARQESGGFANSTRALAAGDAVPGYSDTIDFGTIHQQEMHKTL